MCLAGKRYFGQKWGPTGEGGEEGESIVIKKTN